MKFSSPFNQKTNAVIATVIQKARTAATHWVLMVSRRRAQAARALPEGESGFGAMSAVDAQVGHWE
jgi:hypothetical protein